MSAKKLNMSEGAPVPGKREDIPAATSPENEPQEEQAKGTHHDIARDIVSDHAENLNEEDRKYLEGAIAREVLSIINKHSTTEDMKTEFDRLLSDLHRDGAPVSEAEPTPTEEDEDNPEDTPENQDEIPTNLEQGDESGNNFVMRWRHKMVIGLGTPAALMSKAWGKFTKNDVVKHNSRVRRHEGESDADYYNRMKSHAKTTAGMAAVALAGAASGGVGALGVGGFAGAIGAKVGAVGASIGNAVYQARRKDREFANPVAAAAGGLVGGVASYGIAHDIITHNSGGGNHPVDFDPDKKHQGGDGDNHDQHHGAHDHDLTPDQSRQLEHDWLERTHENGRLGHDYNNINVNASQEDVLGKLHEQYEMSPNELAGQLRQIQELQAEHGGHIPGLPEALQMRDGESYDDYTARLGEALHDNNTLHHDMAEYATNYAKDHYNIQDMPNHYRSSWIDENGKVHWDEDVRTADPNDKIIDLGGGKGIRLPCGQPVEVINDRVVDTPQAGPVVATSVPAESHPSTPVQPVLVEHPTPQQPTPEHPTPVQPETPTTPETPSTPTPETPLDSKIPSQNIDANPNEHQGTGMGDTRVESGPEKPATDPGSTYTAPEAPAPSTSTVDGAETNSRASAGANTQPATPSVEQPLDNGGTKPVETGTVER